MKSKIVTVLFILAAAVLAGVFFATKKIVVNNDSQKGILIGKSGSMLKKIGTEARLELEKILEKKVYLELFVKVQKNWLKDKKAIKNLGYE